MLVGSLLPFQFIALRNSWYWKTKCRILAFPDVKRNSYPTWMLCNARRRGKHPLHLPERITCVSFEICGTPKATSTIGVNASWINCTPVRFPRNNVKLTVSRNDVSHGSLDGTYSFNRWRKHLQIVTSKNRVTFYVHVEFFFLVRTITSSRTEKPSRETQHLALEWEWRRNSSCSFFFRWGIFHI